MVHTLYTLPREKKSLRDTGFLHTMSGRLSTPSQSYTVPGFLERQEGSKPLVGGPLRAILATEIEVSLPPTLPTFLCYAPFQSCYLCCRANGKISYQRAERELNMEVPFEHQLTWVTHERSPGGQFLLCILLRAGSSRLASSADPPTQVRENSVARRYHIPTLRETSRLAARVNNSTV